MQINYHIGSDIIKGSLFTILFVLSYSICSQVNISIGEQVIHSTSKINCSYVETDAKGQFFVSEGSGTGFYYSFRIDSLRTIPCLVTNKHVVRNSSWGEFLVTITGLDSLPDYGNAQKISIGSFEEKWIFHPDPEVDLCILPIGEYLNNLREKGMEPFFVPTDTSIIPTESEWERFKVLEEVTMIGYPNGFYDRQNNVPIVRVGQTATPISHNFNGNEEFIVNIPSIPGSSGSPIYILNEGTYMDDNALIFGSRIYLVGILHAGPTWNARGQGRVVIDNVPINVETSTGITIDLGICIKSSKLNDFTPLLNDLVDE